VSLQAATGTEIGCVREKEQLWSGEMIYENAATLIQDQKSVSLEPNVSVQKAAEKMAENRVGAIPVIAQGKLTGIFTD